MNFVFDWFLRPFFAVIRFEYSKIYFCAFHFFLISSNGVQFRWIFFKFCVRPVGHWPIGSFRHMTKHLNQFWVGRVNTISFSLSAELQCANFHRSPADWIRTINSRIKSQIVAFLFSTLHFPNATNSSVHVIFFSFSCLLPFLYWNDTWKLILVN